MPQVPDLDYSHGLDEWLAKNHPGAGGCPWWLECRGYDGELEPIHCELRAGHDGLCEAEAEIPVAIGPVVGYVAVVTLRWKVKD